MEQENYIRVCEICQDHYKLKRKYAKWPCLSSEKDVSNAVSLVESSRKQISYHI